MTLQEELKKKKKINKKGYHFAITLLRRIFVYIQDFRLREKCPNTEFFLVRIFLYSVQIQE